MRRLAAIVLSLSVVTTSGGPVEAWSLHPSTSLPSLFTSQALTQGLSWFIKTLSLMGGCDSRRYVTEHGIEFSIPEEPSSIEKPIARNDMTAVSSSDSGYFYRALREYEWKKLIEGEGIYHAYDETNVNTYWGHLQELLMATDRGYSGVVIRFPRENIEAKEVYTRWHEEWHLLKTIHVPVEIGLRNWQGNVEWFTWEAFNTQLSKEEQFLRRFWTRDYSSDRSPTLIGSLNEDRPEEPDMGYEEREQLETYFVSYLDITGKPLAEPVKNILRQFLRTGNFRGKSANDLGEIIFDLIHSLEYSETPLAGVKKMATAAAMEELAWQMLKLGPMPNPRISPEEAKAHLKNALTLAVSANRIGATVFRTLCVRGLEMFRKYFDSDFRTAPLVFETDQRDELLRDVDRVPVQTILIVVDNLIEHAMWAPTVRALLKKGHHVILAGAKTEADNTATVDDLRTLIHDPLLHELSDDIVYGRLKVVSTDSHSRGIHLARAADFSEWWHKADVIIVSGPEHRAELYTPHLYCSKEYYSAYATRQGKLVVEKITDPKPQPDDGGWGRVAAVIGAVGFISALAWTHPETLWITGAGIFAGVLNSVGSREVEAQRVDQRIGKSLLSHGLITSDSLETYRSARQAVNPKSHPIRVMIGAAGPSIEEAWLSTHIDWADFVDHDDYSLEGFEALAKNSQKYGELGGGVNFSFYRLTKLVGGYAACVYFYERKLESLVYTLWAMGLDMSRVSVRFSDGFWFMTFPWPESDHVSTIRFVKKDLSKITHEWLTRLLMGNPLHGYLEKAAMKLPQQHVRYLPVIEKVLAPSGWMLFNPFADVASFDPKPISFETMVKMGVFVPHLRNPGYGLFFEHWQKPPFLTSAA